MCWGEPEPMIKVVKKETMTDLNKLTTLEKRYIADEVMREELETAVNKLSEIALRSGIKLTDKGLDLPDQKLCNEIQHTRASLAIEYVNAWKICYDSFEPEDC